MKKLNYLFGIIALFAFTACSGGSSNAVEGTEDEIAAQEVTTDKKCCKSADTSSSTTDKECCETGEGHSHEHDHEHGESHDHNHDHDHDHDHDH